LERWIQKGERPARSANQHQHQKGTSIAKRPNSQIYLCIHVANKSQIYLCIHVANKSPSDMAPRALALVMYCSTELEELHNMALFSVYFSPRNPKQCCYSASEEEPCQRDPKHQHQKDILLVPGQYISLVHCQFISYTLQTCSPSIFLTRCKMWRNNLGSTSTEMSNWAPRDQSLSSPVLASSPALRYKVHLLCLEVML
jgi:hypothetical protein